MSKQDTVLQAALAGLLHDVGKFTGRAGVGESVDRTPAEAKKEVRYPHAEASATFVDNYVPPHIRKGGVRAVEYHHKPDSTPTEQKDIAALAHLVRLADLWAAGERQESPEIPQSSPARTPLVSVLSNVELHRKVLQKNKWGYRLRMLALEHDIIFPVSIDDQQIVAPEDYTDLWEKMRRELDDWRKSDSWNEISPEAYFSTLLALLRKYLTFVPSATPWQADENDRVLPDVSLYDHLKATAAIAACLRAGFDDEQISEMRPSYNEPIAVLVRGDISGIQNFIYRITQPDRDGEFAKVAKRLRGRSFYLTLLGDVVVDWLVHELGVTSANVLFSGGGRFDILAPINCRDKIKDCEAKLATWLLKEFYGELGILVACAEVKPGDLGNMKEVYEAVEVTLGERKQQKWKHHLGDSDFIEPRYEKYHACTVCRITPMPDPGQVCSQCKRHEKIGEKLPYTSQLAFVNGKYSMHESKESCVIDFDAPFATTVILLYASEADKVDEAEEFIARAPKDSPITVYRLNDTSNLINPAAPPNVGKSFRFLANAAPRATVSLASPDVEEPINKGDVLHFDAIARLSDGVRRIGILKADVDRLGLVFGLGIQPTISRLSALSHTIDLFFSGWLNRLCQELFNKWEDKQRDRDEANRLFGRVDGLFYVMYSGGDDMFVVGPWDEMLEFAKRLHADFTKHAGGNPNITLSAGYAQVKPHYPVQRFAELADEAEQKAKNARKSDNEDGRNAIHAFGETLAWTDGEDGYAELLEFAHKLRKDVESKPVPRTLVHDLGHLYRRQSDAPKENKPIFTPRLYYTLTRRLLKEVRNGYLKNDTIRKLQHIMLPVSYVSLSTRKE